jgi:RHS repeat-associated protein
MTTLALCVAFVLVSVSAASAAPMDPAPLPDDVVRRLVRGQAGSRPPRPMPAVVARHLDEVVGLLGRLEQDEATAAPGSARATTRMLLASKVHELDAARGEIRERHAGVRARLLALGQPDQVSAWDDVLTTAEERFDRVARAIGDVVRAAGAAESTRARRQARAELETLHRRVRTQETLPGGGAIPTWRFESPSTHRRPAKTVKPPEYLAASGDGGSVSAVAGQRLAAAPAPTPPEAQACSYTAADVGENQEVRLTPAIRALADSLGHSPARIFEYVANQIDFQPYYGSLKGAVATLESRAGNATDQASLLIALLRASNIPARYVRGEISFPDDGRLPGWVGARTQQAAAAILRQGQVPATYSTATSEVEFTHVWAEACVPYGNYRGAAVDLTGHRWIPLDPSFKERTFQAGIPTSVPFDYSGAPGTFMARRSHTLPDEAYAEQVAAGIKTLPPHFANNTLGDVGYVGATVPRSLDLLPASLPYRVVTFVGWDSTGAADAAAVDDDHRYKLEIVPESGAVAERDLTSFSSFFDFALNVRAVVLSVPEVVRTRVTLAFRGATAGDQATLDAWRNDGDVAGALPCTVTVVPVVRVDGVEQPLTAPSSAAVLPSMNVCTTANRLTLRVTLPERSGIQIVGRPLTAVNQVVFRNIQAGSYHALFGYAFQASDPLLAERAGRLLASVRGTLDPNASQEETEGELLHLVGLKYLRYVSDAAKRLGELDGASGETGNHLGLTAARAKVEYVFDLPFAVTREGFLIDVPGGLSRTVDLSTGQPVWGNFLLAGYTMSALESYVWQENARLDAVSTVRGLQFARETGIPVLTVNGANWATEKPKLTSNSNPVLDYDPAQVATIETSYINQGFTVTIPRSLIQYDNWRGAVFVAEKNDLANPTTPGATAAFIIDQYAGGYTVDEILPEFFLPELGTGYETVSLADQTPETFTSAQGLGTTAFTTSGGDPVNMVTGNMYHVERDLVIKGRGLPLIFERTYNSRSQQPGPLGFGWTHSFDHRLLFADDDADGAATVADADGFTSSVVWVDGTGSEKFVRVSSTTAGVAVGSVFTTPPGFFFQVTREPDGTYAVREKSGLRYVFESLAGTVGQRARLLRIEDRNGNALTLGHTGARLGTVTDGLGRRLTFTYDAGDRIVQLCDWTARCHQYVYDANGDLVTYRNPLAVAGAQAPVTYAYYSTPGNPADPIDHAMRSYTLPRGNGMTFEYYTNGRVFRHYRTQEPAAAMTFTYNVFRREASHLNERGFRRRFFFDPSGNPLKIIEETGAERTYAYDPASPMTRILKRDPRGHETRYAHDGHGNVTRITNPSGSTVEFSHFTAFGQPGKVKDARGHHTVFKYDARGNLLEEIALRAGVGATVDPVTYVPGPAEVVAWTIHTYDAFGNLASTRRVRDAATQAGPTITYTYDAQGLSVVRVTRCGDLTGDGVAEPCEASPTLAHDALGRPTVALRADWYTVTTGYDALDRVTQQTDEVGGLRSLAYDPNGNLTSTVLPGEDQTTWTYDAADRKIGETNAGGFTTRFAYDLAGNLIAVTDPDGVAIAFEHDAGNRVILAFDEEGNAVSRTLDADGRPRTITDPNGATATLVYYGPDRDGRLKQRVGPATPAAPGGRTTTYDYDAAGNVISVTDHLGRTVLTTHDELGRAVRIVGPASTDPTLGTIRPVTRLVYNLLGHRIRVEAGHTDASGTNPEADVVSPQVVSVVDDFGRTVRDTDTLGHAWQFAHDVHGNPVRSTDPRGTVIASTWGYGHQLLARTDVTNPLAPVALVSFTRNALGQVLSAERAGVVTHHHAYDAAHRLATVTDSRGGKTLAYTWTPGGLLSAVDGPDGARTDYLYDPVGRLTGIWAPNGDVVSFVYDAGGRLVEKWFPNGVTARYAWHADDTLAEVVNQQGGAVLSHHAYTYDPVGNRVTHTEQIAGTTAAWAYAYDALDRLLEARDTTAVPPVVEQYAYDVLGNRTGKSDGVTTIRYLHDAANQLTEIRQGTTTGPLQGALVYDAAGNVVKKCVGGGVSVTATDCSGSAVLGLAYDPLNRLIQATRTGRPTEQYGYDAEGRRVLKTVGGLQTQYVYQGPDIVAEYPGDWLTPGALLTHGPNLDDPLLRTIPGATQYYHQDGVGSVVAVTDDSGATHGSARYDAWGNATSVTGTIPLYGYTGREPDATGLIYYRARYYDPALGRFLQRDPLGVDDGVNLYAYVGNNPINRADPSGLRNILVPGTAISGKRENAWWQPESEFAAAFARVTKEKSTQPLDWPGGNIASARASAAADLAVMVNSVPRDEKIYIFAHSHGGNVVAEASRFFTRRVDLVVTAGTPVRPEYRFDMRQIGRGVAISSPNDLIQVSGGNLGLVPFVGETGWAGRIRTEPGFTNVPVPEFTDHSAYYREVNATMAAIQRAMGGSTSQATSPPLGPYTGGGAVVRPEPAGQK